MILVVGQLERFPEKRGPHSKTYILIKEDRRKREPSFYLFIRASLDTQGE